MQYNKYQTQKREELKAYIGSAQLVLDEANAALIAFDEALENNVYESLEDAEELEEVLLELAYQDCEGSHCCGSSVYEREFLVGSTKYCATLEVEYNRHDKTYYYLDDSTFTIKEVI